MKRSHIVYQSGEELEEADFAIMQMAVSLVDGVFDSIRLSWARIEHEFFVFVRLTTRDGSGDNSGRVTFNFQPSGLTIASCFYSGRLSVKSELAVDYGDPEMLDAVGRFISQLGESYAH